MGDNTDMIAAGADGQAPVLRPDANTITVYGSNGSNGGTTHPLAPGVIYPSVQPVAGQGQPVVYPSSPSVIVVAVEAKKPADKPRFHSTVFDRI